MVITIISHCYDTIRWSHDWNIMTGASVRRNCFLLAPVVRVCVWLWWNGDLTATKRQWTPINCRGPWMNKDCTLDEIKWEIQMSEVLTGPMRECFGFRAFESVWRISVCNLEFCMKFWDFHETSSFVWVFGWIYPFRVRFGTFLGMFSTHTGKNNMSQFCRVANTQRTLHAYVPKGK